MKAIINGKVFTVTGQTFDKATVLVDNGKIKAVGPDIELPEGTEVIDASGCWVTPGKEKLIQILPWITRISRMGRPTDRKVKSSTRMTKTTVRTLIRILSLAKETDRS